MSNVFIYLCGSSSVGKTTLMQAIPTVYNGRTIETVKMDFTSVREQLGNPSWDDLESKVDVLEAQQSAGMGIYEGRISAICDNVVDDRIYLFERSPLDIAGYSHAFGASDAHMADILSRAYALLQLCCKVGTVLLIYRPVDVNYPYDRRNNTRPNEKIRMRCNSFLRRRSELLSTTDFVDTLNFENLTVLTSVNEGQEEIDNILKHVG